MSLLLCFFVVLVSMGEIKPDGRFQKVMESLQRAFGGTEDAAGSAPVLEQTGNALIASLVAIGGQAESDALGGSTEQANLDQDLRVSEGPSGLNVVIAGRVAFDAAGAALKPEGLAVIARAAVPLRGFETKLLVRGHAASESLPADSPFADLRDLTYARAKAVCVELERHGVPRERLVPVAVGDLEPLVERAYTEERRTLNRRVDILVTDELVDDHAGSTLSDPLKESGDAP